MSLKAIAYSSLALLVAATTACTPASPPSNTTVSAEVDGPEGQTESQRLQAFLSARSTKISNALPRSKVT